MWGCQVEPCRKELIIEWLLSMETVKETVLTLCQHVEQRLKDKMGNEPANKHRQLVGVSTEGLGDKRTPDIPVINGQSTVYESSTYLDLLSDAEVHTAYKAFYQATSSASVSSSVCGVCACECGPIDEELTMYSLEELPNSHSLIPSQSHPLHDLFAGKLLEPAGIEGEPGSYRVKTCKTCLNDL